MDVLLLVVISVISVALILLVLIQNPKGGGINSEFGSAVQLGGAKRANSILEKGTWGLAIGVAFFCLVLAVSYQPTNIGGADEVDAEGIELDATGETPVE
ncbi:MAG: preprotein translocase subunit SecG [Crocinitomicaceae bacterium]